MPSLIPVALAYTGKLPEYAGALQIPSDIQEVVIFLPPPPHPEAFGKCQPVAPDPSRAGAVVPFHFHDRRPHSSRSLSS